MFKVVTDYPICLSIVCLALGFLYAYMLYGKASVNSEISVGLKRLLFVSRLIVVSLLAFFLLGPLIKTTLRTVEKPLIVIAQDNSSSILLTSDSTFYKGEYQTKLNKLSESLKDKYDVRLYTFGEKLTEGLNATFSEKQTDMQSLFNEIEMRYVNRNLGAVILGTDGIYNVGESPLYDGANLKVPIYTIALGDTMVKRDLILKKVNHNKSVFLGNTFPLEIVLQAKQYKGSMAQLVIKKEGTVILSQAISIPNNAFTTSIPFQIKAETKGIMHFEIELKPLLGEFTLINNKTQVFIDVLDTKQKVLLLADAPHPDISAIRQSLNKNESYEVDYSLVADFSKSIEAYNLVILHGFPSNNNANTKLLNELQKSTVSQLYILANNVNLSTFNSVQRAIKITNARAGFNDCLPEINPNFTFFNLSKTTSDVAKNFPPLQIPFGSIEMSAGSQILMKQKIGAIITENPLLFFSEINETKIGVVMGEGIWKWKVNNYQQQNNNAAFDEILSKTVQYLAVKSEKSLFKVNTKNSVPENEDIIFDAQLFNESFESIVTPDVKLFIANEAGKKFDFIFAKNNGTYQLNAGKLPIGKYAYQANVKSGDKSYTQAGNFTVNGINLEGINTTADHQILANLSKQTGATMVNPKELEKLEKLLSEKEEITPVSYTEQNLQDLINIKVVFYFLLALLTLEWFVRKRNGGY